MLALAMVVWVFSSVELCFLPMVNDPPPLEKTPLVLVSVKRVLLAVFCAVLLTINI